MARYSASFRMTNAPTATLPGGSLYSGGTTNRLNVVEVGVFNTTTTACLVNLMRLTTAGTQGAAITEAKFDTATGANVATAVNSHTVAPTLGNEVERADLGAAIGAGVIWTFDDRNPLVIGAGTGNGLGILTLTGTGQVCDIYFVWDE